MRKATFIEALENTAPQPVALICTPRPDGSTNLTPVAWWTYLESEPPMPRKPIEEVVEYI
jgi:flavin reductase (DIM6/NTAB) family NADH-FMN oxidoreductase RutF